MMYQAFQSFTDMMAPSRFAARSALQLRDNYMGSLGNGPVMRRLFALCDVYQGARITHHRPPYGITQVQSGNGMERVEERIALDQPFGNLLHFSKPDLKTLQPKMLVVAPLSGHFATLLRNTVATLLQDHDVYITDWKNARDVPLSAGRFGFEDYTDYVIRFLQEMGPQSNVVAVCQPCVPALAAVSIMAQDNDPCQPCTLTLMGGPVDVRVSPTVVNELANEKPIQWFKDNLITSVPWRYAGAGRRVYPSFLQLTAFMSMNLSRHGDQHRKLYQLLADGSEAEAQNIKDFYDEYFAVTDLTEEFYIETVDVVFQQAALAQGLLRHRGRIVEPSAIRKTALLTVEGERDDICAVGQTSAAHTLCSGLRPHLKRHHLQTGVGHYGIFSGSKWERQVYPQVKNLVLAMA